MKDTNNPDAPNMEVRYRIWKILEEKPEECEGVGFEELAWWLMKNHGLQVTRSHLGKMAAACGTHEFYTVRVNNTPEEEQTPEEVLEDKFEKLRYYAMDQASRSDKRITRLADRLNEVEALLRGIL